MASSISSSNQQQVGQQNNSSSSSSGSGSGSEADPQQTVDVIRKRKRMQSNRESARRSRLRKQKHMDDLTAEVSQLKDQNHKIFINTTATTQLYVNVEAENSVLRAQLAELSHRLQSLNDIITCVNSNNNSSFDVELDDGFTMNPWGFSFATYPIMPTQDVFMC